MDTTLPSLIAALKQAVPMELRSSPSSTDYLEGVLLRPNLQRCYALLAEALGPPLKEFGKAAAFEPDVRKMIDQLGGIRTDQCLFLAPTTANRFLYAALWPWASDPTRVTLKVGEYTAA